MVRKKTFGELSLEELSLEELVSLFVRAGRTLDTDLEDITHTCSDCGSIEINHHWDGWALLSNLQDGLNKRVKKTTGKYIWQHQDAWEKEKGANNE
jgi:predicted transglutaminase-like cysteine proteinase